jgi:2-iminobutanoate/2-iminopropanoate deaminase
MTDSNQLHPVITAEAPAAIGPYSQGMRSGDLLFISGQIPLDPQTGELIEGDIEAQTHRVMHNLRAIARAAGTDLDGIVKTTIFLKDMGDFARVNAVYGSYFASAPPARSTVQVAALPKDVPIEIEAVVRIP